MKPYSEKGKFKCSILERGRPDESTGTTAEERDRYEELDGTCGRAVVFSEPAALVCTAVHCHLLNDAQAQTCTQLCVTALAHTRTRTISDLVAFCALHSTRRPCQVTQLEQRGGPKIQREMVRDRKQAVRGSVFVCMCVCVCACAGADNSG